MPLIRADDRRINKLAYAESGKLDLSDLAAAYAYGIASNHAFNDASKRTGWACCALFLKINGIDVTAAAIEVVDRMLLLVEGRLDEVDFAEWLRTSPRRLLPTQIQARTTLCQQSQAIPE